MTARDGFLARDVLIRRLLSLGAYMRQIDPHRRSQAKFAVDRNVAIGLFGKAVHHAETKPAALADLLGRIEGLERARGDFPRHPDTIVGDGDHGVLAGLDPWMKAMILIVERRNTGAQRQTAAIGHGVLSIEREV